MKDYFKRLWLLFSTFFKIGAFTFGGGYAMISLIGKEVVDKHKWLDDGDILDIVAIAESTPGPIAINASTFVGYKVAGFWGAFFATLGTVLPSFTIILIIAYLLSEFASITAVRYAFFGIRAGVLSLLLKSLSKMYKQSPKGTAAYIVMALAFAFTTFFDVQVIFVIIGCALFGLATFMLAKKGGKAE